MNISSSRKKYPSILNVVWELNVFVCNIILFIPSCTLYGIIKSGEAFKNLKCNFIPVKFYLFVKGWRYTNGKYKPVIFKCAQIFMPETTIFTQKSFSLYFDC